MKKYFNLDPRIRAKVSEVIDHPVVIRVNKFTEESLERFSEQMSLAHQVKQPVIPVVICSYGGAVDPLMGMIGEIQSSKIPVATVVESKAMSAGAILFSFGTQGHRYMGPNARLMIHGVSSTSVGQAGDLQADADETARMNDVVLKMMAKNCGHKPDYFLDILHDNGNCDWYLDAKEAKKHGIANHLRVPSLTVSIKVEMSFE